MVITYLSKLVRGQAAAMPDHVAFRHRDDATQTWIPTTWAQFSAKVEKAARALAVLGMAVHDKIATCTQNKPEGLIVDFAAYQNRLAVVPLYATSSSAQIEYILKDSGARILFVGEQYQYDHAYEVVKSLDSVIKLIIFDPNVTLCSDDKTSIYFDNFLQLGEDMRFKEIVDERVESSDGSDLTNLIYTSGTTGEPKGVMLDNDNFMVTFRAHKDMFDMTEQDSSMCFLPMAHIFERAWSYFCLSMGTPILVNLRPIDVQKSLRETEPTIMCAVPRFWEKVYQAVLDKRSRSRGLVAYLMDKAIETGKEYNLNYRVKRRKAPWGLALRYKLYDKLVLSKIRLVAGLKNARILPCSGAALSTNINQFLHAIGIPINYGYGMTETCATICCTGGSGFSFGNLGFFIPGVLVKIGEQDEILVKGGGVMRGYYNKPKETAEVFTADGWFKTGDAGRILPNGCLTMTDRLKDLYKTANGKYIAPQAIEGRLGENPYIEQVATIGDQRKFVSALVVPAFTALEDYANEQGIVYADRAALVKNPQIIQFMEQQIQSMQTEFASYEQVKRFTLMSESFSADKGELTATLKLRRRPIYANYSALIDAMYAY